MHIAATDRRGSPRSHSSQSAKVHIFKHFLLYSSFLLLLTLFFNLLYYLLIIVSQRNAKVAIGTQLHQQRSSCLHRCKDGCPPEAQIHRQSSTCVFFLPERKNSFLQSVQQGTSITRLLTFTLCHRYYRACIHTRMIIMMITLKLGRL